MERKNEHFFDWANGDKLSITKLVTQLQQHPQEAEKILDYVISKVKHYTEFEVKKEHLKERYDHKLNELYAEYMGEE